MHSGTQQEQARLPSKGNFLPSLNGGRAIAALMVVGGHFLALQFATPVGTAEIYNAEAQGRGASDEFLFNTFTALVPVPINFFFVLSGFVLTWIYRPGQTATGFWLKRLGKVYPVYLLTSLAAFVLWGVIANAWTDWKTVLTHIFVLQAWTPDQRYLLGLNTVMWTLSSEMFLYLLFPALILMLVNFSRNALKLVAVACVAGSFVLPWLVGKNFTLRQPPPELAPLEGFDNQFVYWFTLMFPPMRLFQFVLGMSVALLMRQGLKYIPNIPVALVIFAAGLTLTNLYLPVESKNVAGMLIPIAILIAALAKADLESKWNPFRLRPLLFVGKISYSIYAVHILFILFTMVQIPQASGAWDWPRVWLANAGLIDDPKVALPGWANFGIFFTYVAVIMFTAWLLYKFVEQPVGRFIRNRLRETKPATPAPTNGQVHPAEAPALAASAAQRD